MPPLDGWTYPTLTAPTPDEPATPPSPAPLTGWTYDAPAQPVPPAPEAPLAGWSYDTPAPSPAPAQPVPGPDLPGGIYGDPDMPGAMPPADPNDHRQGVTDSIVAALTDTMREGRQLARGDAFSRENIPAPVDRTMGGRLAYGLTSSAPTLGAMALGAAGGAAAGTAVAPGPGTAVGGVLGGAAGGGVMDFARGLIPAYQDATRRGLTHEAAVDEAYQSAAASGLLTAVTAPLFAAKPFKSVVGNLLLAGGVTGPGVGAVHRGVINPAITGQPAPGVDEMISNALEDAIGGGLTMGAMHAGPAIARRFMPDGRPELNVPPPEGPPPGPRQLPGPPASPLRPGEVAVTPGQPEPYPEPPPAPPGPVPGAPVVPVPTPAPGEPTPAPGTPPNAPATIPPNAVPLTPQPDAPLVPEPPGPAPVTPPAAAPPPGAGPTGIVPLAPGTQPGVIPPGDSGVTPPETPPATPAPGEQPGTETGTKPEISALPPGAGGTEGEAPTPPPTGTKPEQTPLPGATPRSPEAETTPIQPGSAAHELARLDRENAPDEAYKGPLATATKDALKPGETWRDRLVRVVESQRPLETTATSAGRKIDYRYEVREANELTPASGDLQPRDRQDRVQAQAQQNDIYAKFDPERLHGSPEADRGAPIIGPKAEDPANTLEAGNNRVAVIKRIHAGQTPEDQTRSQAYRAMIHRVTGQDTGRMTSPVLVRRRMSPLTPDERRAFVQEANTPATQAMSGTEQAQVDASNLSHDHLATLDPEKDITSAANRSFVNAWVQKLPQTEHNRVMDADGYLSADGVRRLNAAILARAYGDKGTLARGLESTNDEIKGISGALADAAPAMAKLRSGVEKGEFDKTYDIAARVAEAADRVRQAREQGIKRDDILNQGDVFNPLDPVTAQIVRAFYDPTGQRAASRVAMADTLRQYARVASSEAAPKGLLPGEPPLSPEDILKTLVDARNAKKTKADTGQGGLFTPAKGTGPELAGPEPAPAPAPTAKPVKPAKAVKPAPPETRTVDARDLKVGDTIRTPKGEHLTVTSIERNKVGSVLATVEGRKKPLDYAPRKEVKVLAEPKEPEALADERLTDAEVDTALQARRAGAPRPQRRAAPVPGAPAPLPKRIRTLKTPDPTPVPQAGAPLTQEDVSYSVGTPRYEGAFIHALHGTGIDPRTAMNKPLGEQVDMLSRAVQDKYGFGRVIIDPGVDLKITRDQLLNMHQHMQGMANAMGWPNSVLSLDGRLNLRLVPRNFQGSHWMGMYQPAIKTISISGGSNSYAHEHWHGIDDYLSDLLNNHPNKATLFTHAARHDQLDANNTIHTAFAHVLNTMFYGDGEVALRRLTLETTAARTTPAGLPTQAALDAREQIRRLDAGSTRLRIPPSMFRASAAGMPDPAYFASAHELFARAGEAYTAWAMAVAGNHTEGVVKSDEGYRSQLLAYMKAAYPNAQDRTRIFQAFGDLRTELERASVLPLHGPGALPPTEAHTTPPAHTRPASIGPGLMARIRADIQAIKLGNLRGGDHESVVSPGEQVTPPMIYTGKNNAPVRQTQGVRTADTLSEFWNSALGNMERWIEQIPPAARPAMTKLRDMLGHDPGSGRLIGQTFEERARHYAQKTTTLLEDIFHDAGLVNRVGRTHLTKTQQEDLWHTLATGDTRYPLDAHDVNKTGRTRPISSAVLDAAKVIRLDIFEKSYDMMKKSGLPIGHTKEGYVPRVMNDAKILSDPQAFIRDVTAINGVIQENDFSTSNQPRPVRLAQWWADTERTVRDSPLVFTDVQRDAMNELTRNLRRIAAVNAELASGGASNPTAHNPQALRDELDRLETRNQEIHDDHGQAVLDAIARNEAENMANRIVTGKPQDFTTLGPRSEFLRQRTLPPEADQVLRKWYVSDPKVAIPMYVHSMSRKLAYHEVFGPSGNNITALIHEAVGAGMHGDHARKFNDVVETVTGRSTRQSNSADTRLFNFISAWGELITMSGATLSALAEPTAMVLHGGSFRQVLKTYSNLMGQFFGTLDGAERMRIARQIGAISSVLQGSAMANRATDYSGTPVMGAIVNNFFELAMSPAIRMIRAATIGPSWSLLKDLLEVAQAPATTRRELDRQDDARRLIRDFGLADHQIDMMHAWAQTVTGDQPTPEQIATTREGHVYEVVANRILDRLNVNPTAAEKPLGALKTSYGNMMLGLTSFVWGFFRNGVLPAFRKIGHAGHRQFERAKAQGATDAQAWRQAKGAQLRYSLMAAVAAATLTLGTGIVGTARTYIFNHDAWEKHAEAGDLAPWLFGNAVSQSGLNGPLDMIGQAYHSLRYTADLSNLVSGPFLATELRYAADVLGMVNDIISGEARTNTKFYNGVHALLQLAGKPGALVGLTWLMRRLPAGGPLAAAVTAASIGGVSTTVTRGITNTAAGERGTTLPDPPKEGALPALPNLPDLPPLTPGEAKGGKHPETGMTAAIGIADDLLMPIIQALPGPAKTAAVGAAAVGTMIAAYYRGAQFREHGTPPTTKH